jgi:hypothetical protein
MLAGPDCTPNVMMDALSHSSNALDAVADLDVDRSDDDRDFFRAQQANLAVLLGQLIGAFRALEDHDRGARTRLQVRVVIGDKVLDRGVESGNTLTKNALKDKPGLGADHVFGKRVTELTEEELEKEPGEVKKAMGRMANVPDFAGKQGIVDDLRRRADRQQGCLDERRAGREAREQLESTLDRLVHQGAEALATLEGLLLARFPRQKDYVRKFFLDVSPEKNTKKKPASGEATPAKDAAKPAEGAAPAKEAAKDAAKPAEGAEAAKAGEPEKKNG